jgi:hypothetical protein
VAAELRVCANDLGAGEQIVQPSFVPGEQRYSYAKNDSGTTTTGTARWGSRFTG